MKNIDQFDSMGNLNFMSKKLPQSQHTKKKKELEINIETSQGTITIYGMQKGFKCL